MIDSHKKFKLVGAYIRQKREKLGFSQRALGAMLSPPVTTQFISNLERGVTPLPLVHIPAMVKALGVEESEIRVLLEKEYALKLSGRLGKDAGEKEGETTPFLAIAEADYELMRKLYSAYQVADSTMRQSFINACENILKMQKLG